MNFSTVPPWRSTGARIASCQRPRTSRSDSASSASPSVVDPTRSQKRIVTVLRAAAAPVIPTVSLETNPGARPRVSARPHPDGPAGSRPGDEVRQLGEARAHPGERRQGDVDLDAPAGDGPAAVDHRLAV